jgi:hypothetical protein
MPPDMGLERACGGQQGQEPGPGLASIAYRERSDIDLRRALTYKHLNDFYKLV